MKFKKVATTIAAVAISFSLFTGSSFADDQWAACTPAQIGPYGSEVRVKVTGCNIDPAAGLKWMTLSSEGTDQMMAAILTAMSMGKPIAVAFDGTKSAKGYNIANAVIFSNE